MRSALCVPYFERIYTKIDTVVNIQYTSNLYKHHLLWYDGVDSFNISPPSQVNIFRITIFSPLSFITESIIQYFPTWTMMGSLLRVCNGSQLLRIWLAPPNLPTLITMFGKIARALFPGIVLFRCWRKIWRVNFMLMKTEWVKHLPNHSTQRQ